MTLLEAYPHLFADNDGQQTSSNSSEIINVNSTTTSQNHTGDKSAISKKSEKTVTSSKASDRKVETKRKGRPRMNEKSVKSVGMSNSTKFLVSQKNLSQFTNNCQIASLQQNTQQLESPEYVSPVYRPLRQPLRMSDHVSNCAGGSSCYSSYTCSTPKPSKGSAASLCSFTMKSNWASVNGKCFCCNCRQKNTAMPMVNAILTLKHVGYSSKQQNESITESSVLNSTSNTISDELNTTVGSTFSKLRPILPKTDPVFVASLKPLPKTVEKYLPKMPHAIANLTQVRANQRSAKKISTEKAACELRSFSSNLSHASLNPASSTSFSEDSALGTRSSIFSDHDRDFHTSTQKQSSNLCRELFEPELVHKMNNKKAKDYSCFYAKLKRQKQIPTGASNNKMNFDLRIYPDIAIADNQSRKKSKQSTFRDSIGMKETREIVCPPSCNCWNDGKEDQVDENGFLTDEHLKSFKLKEKLITSRRIVPTRVVEPINESTVDVHDGENRNGVLEESSSKAPSQVFRVPSSNTSRNDNLTSENQKKYHLNQGTIPGVSDGLNDVVITDEEKENSEIENILRSSEKRKRSSYRKTIICSSSENEEDDAENLKIESIIRSSKKQNPSSQRKTVLCSSPSENEGDDSSVDLSFSVSPEIKKLKNFDNWHQSENPPLNGCGNNRSEDEAFCDEESRSQSPDLIDWIESRR